MLLPGYPLASLPSLVVVDHCWVCHLVQWVVSGSALPSGLQIGEPHPREYVASPWGALEEGPSLVWTVPLEALVSRVSSIESAVEFFPQLNLLQWEMSAISVALEMAVAMKIK